MASFDLLLRGFVPDGFVLELILSLGLQTIALIPLALVLAVLLRRSSASVRHLAWLLVLFAMIASPIVSACSQGQTQFSILHPAKSPPEEFVTETLTAPTQRTGFAKPETQQLQVACQLPERFDADLASDQGQKRAAVATAPLIALANHSEGTSVVRESADEDVSRIRMTELFLTAIWLVGIFVLGLRVFLGQSSMWRTLRGSLPLRDERVLGVAREAMIETAGKTEFEVFENPAVNMPMTCGMWRPLIVLPTAAAEWSNERLRMVLLHELAHVRRRDCLWQCLANILTVSQWFNPLAWLVVSRLKIEREQACDDAVLNNGIQASDYAETLLDLSTGGRRNVVEMCAGLAMARPQRLAARVESIVDESRSRSGVSLMAGFSAVVVSFVLIVPLGVIAQAEITQPQPTEPNAVASTQPAAISVASAKPQLQQQLAAQDVEKLRQTEATQKRQKKALTHVTLPGGQMLQRSNDQSRLVEAAIALLRSASVEIPYQGQRDSSVTLLFSPSWEVELSTALPVKDRTGRIGRMYVDVSRVAGPESIAVEIDGKYRSFTKHQLRDWVAFRREYDRLDFGRPRPVIPSVGDWSKSVNGLQARLAIENWRDPIVAVYLELRNVKNLANTMTVPLDAEKIDFELLDADGRKMPAPGLPRSGPVTDLRDFQLPFDSSLKFNLSVTTVGVPNVSAMIALRNHAWPLKDGASTSYRLRASFKVEKPERFSHTLWYGEVDIPPVEVRPSPRTRPADEVVSRTYSVDGQQRDELAKVLQAWFEFEEDVRITAGEKPDEIQVAAHESCHRYVAEVVSHLKNERGPSG